MSPIRQKNLQRAQGMVEFALVLPILLLVVLGIFAFGHLFFAYSSVVSASREAARWGSAVGVANSMRPRFQDCDAIRAQAVRVGSFAGVDAKDLDLTNPDDFGIFVDYDGGPDLPFDPADPTPPTCPQGGMGPDEVGYGNRINVTVRVQYRPIVPVVNIASFPLEAVTSRTIIRSLPVGEAATAAPACPSTMIIMEFLPVPIPNVLPAFPVVGQPVNVRVRVTSSDNTSPTGTVDIVDDAGHACSVSATSADPGNTCSPQVLVPEGYPEVATHFVSAYYDNGGACYQPSELIDEPLDIIKANTTVTITANPQTSNFPGQDVLLTATVSVVSPGVGVPTGTMTFSDLAGNTYTANMINQTATWTVSPMETTSFAVVYDGDLNFNPSPPTTWVQEVTQEATLTPTPKKWPTATWTPAPIPDCPFPVDNSFNFNVTNGFQFQITNPLSGTSTYVSNIVIDWEITNPAAKLNEARFGASVTSCVKTGSPGSRNCLFQSNSGGATPPHQTLSTVSNWYGGVNGNGLLSNDATPKTMLFAFNGSLLSGTTYSMTIFFDDGKGHQCSFPISGTRP